MPIESTRGPYGGYRVGRGLRLPPLMFTTDEALALVMAVIEGPGDATDDPVASALGKIIRVLPEPVADPAETVRTVSARRTDPAAVRPDPGTTARLVQAAAAGLRVRLRYRLEPHDDPGDGRRPVGRGGAPRPLVPPGLVAQQGRPPGAPGGPGGARRGARGPVRPARRPRPGPDPRGAPLRGVAPRRRRRRRGAAGGGGPEAAAQARPPRGDRRAPHPAGRQHRRARLVRRPPGRPRRRLPGLRAARAARRRSGSSGRGCGAPAAD